MGSTGSKIVRKIVSPFNSSPPVATETGGCSELDNYHPKPKGRASTSPMILKRRGSMFFDEDGDLAHEFYEEVQPTDGSKPRMERVRTNLVPQGDVTYSSPRLSADYPIVLYHP